MHRAPAGVEPVDRQESNLSPHTFAGPSGMDTRFALTRTGGTSAGAMLGIGGSPSLRTFALDNGLNLRHLYPLRAIFSFVADLPPTSAPRCLRVAAPPEAPESNRGRLLPLPHLEKCSTASVPLISAGGGPRTRIVSSVQVWEFFIPLVYASLTVLPC